MDAPKIDELYTQLGFPSAVSFHKSLNKKGFQIKLSDVKEFVKSRSERQVTGPKPKYEGKIVSFDFNHNWFADLISFVSRPVKNAEGTFKYVLSVQDVFSRFIWTRVLESTTHTTDAFEEILKESEDRMVDADPYPQECTTDGGGEFNNQEFKRLCDKYNIEHIVKAPNDAHAIATLDRAIGVLKKIIQRFQISKGGNWLTNLDAAVKAYNDTENGTTKAEPNDVTDRDRFYMRQKAAIDLSHNTRLIRKRQDKLRGSSYRIHEPGKELKGLRQRIDANTWSKDIHVASDFPKPGIVRDINGIETLTKFALPIPSDSSKIHVATDNLQPYAQRLKNTLVGSKNMGQLAKEMKKEVGFTQRLKENKLTFQQFIRKYPQYIRIHDGRVFPTT